MAPPPLAAALRRHVLGLLLPHSRHLCLLAAHTISPSDESDFEPDHPLPRAPDGELAAFLRRLSDASTAASSPKHALSLLLSSPPSPGPSLTSRRDLLVRALWELRRDPDAAVLALRYVAADEVNKAIKTFDAMEKFKTEADQTVFYSLLRALCKNKNIEDAEELLLIRKKFFPLTAEGFNIILDGWCNVITDIAEAKRVWREMSNYCIIPDRTSYTLMVSCFAKVGNLFDTLRVYDEMKKRGWTPSIAVYNSLIHVLTKENCMKDAQNIFTRINSEGLQPNVETYNSMIVPLCESRKLDEARMVLEDMMLKGIVPTILTYHTFLRQESIDETLKLLRKMKDDGCGPKSDTFLMLFDRFFQLNEPGHALKLWNEMKRYDIRPSYSHYMSVVQGLIKHGCMERALEYHDEMKENGFASDPKLEKEFRTFLLANRDHWRGAGKYNIIPQRGKHFARQSRI
uniref:Pentacotripeptide-repeat region of PRORP domain-containing protein n=1 Tax=Oryza punctata TaxID=4537 RepID=A0A0E0LT45_ORYPU